jgi:hypothetical protein
LNAMMERELDVWFRNQRVGVMRDAGAAWSFE